MIKTLVLALIAATTGVSIQVTVVEVPVNVYDRNGNAVRGLEAADFEITDDGRKREITHFEEVDLARVAAEKTVPPPAARRNFMLLFDLANSELASLTRSRTAALAFIEKELLPSDVVSVATYTSEGRFELLMNFTTDREALIAAVTTLGNPKFFKSSDPIRITGRGVGLAEMGAMNGKRVAEANDAAFAAANTIQDRAAVRTNDEFLRGRINQQIKTLADIGRVLDAISGRKQIILLSEGFDGRLVQGRDAFGSTGVETQVEGNQILSGEAYSIDNDLRFGNTSAASTVNSMAELFKRSDVVLHALDIKGLRGETDPYAAKKRNSNEGLYVLTRPTGGEVFKNSNDLSGSFRALLKQQEVVYVLAFEVSGGASPGKFHNLKVKVKAPGARASYRPGYYESGGRISAMEATLTAGEILLNDVALDAVKPNVVAAPFPVAGQNPQVPVIVEVDGATIISAARDQTVKGEIFVYAFDQKNNVADFLYQKLLLDLTKVTDILQKSGVKYYGTLSLPPGDYAIKTLVRFADARLDGFKRVELTVPDFSSPAVLPPIAMEQPGGWFMVRGAKDGHEPAYPFAIAAESFVPGGLWQVKQDAPKRFALFLYHVDPKDVALGVTLKMPDGTTRPANISIVGMTAPDAASAAQLVLELKSDGLPAGRYALDLSVKPKAGGWARAFTIPVFVQ